MEFFLFEFYYLIRQEPSQTSFQTMLNLIEHLPVALVATDVLRYLSLRDIVMMERACICKKSKQLFHYLITHCPPVEFPYCKHTNIQALNWLSTRQFKISCGTIYLPCDSNSQIMKNLQVEKFNIHIQSRVTTAEISILFVESNIGCKVRQIHLCGNQSKDVMEQLSIFTRNVEQLHLYSDNSHSWLSADILRIWKLKRISLNGPNLTISMILLIVQTCAELTLLYFLKISMILL